MFSHAMNRYTKGFGPLFLAGFVMSLFTGVPQFLVKLVMGGAAAVNFMSIMKDMMNGGAPDLGSLVSLAYTVFAGMAITLLISMLVGPLVSMGIASAAQDALEGKRVDVAKTIKAGLSGWGRGLGYTVLAGITITLAMIIYFLVVALVAQLGLVGVVLAVLLGIGGLYVYFVLQASFYYGLYALANDNKSIGDAFGVAWGGLFANMVDRLTAGGVLLLISLVFGIAGLLVAWIPLVGAPAVAAATSTFILLYIGARYTGATGDPAYGGAPAQAPSQEPPQQ